MHWQQPAGNCRVSWFLTIAEPCGHSLSWILFPAEGTWNGLWSIWWLDTPAAPPSMVSPPGLVSCWHQPLACFSFLSPCCHVPPIPLPEASVWLLKGTLKFSSTCYCLYIFWWPSWTTWDSLGVIILLQYGGWGGHICWICLVSKDMAGNRQSSHSPFLLHLYSKHFPQITDCLYTFFSCARLAVCTVQLFSHQM